MTGQTGQTGQTTEGGILARLLQRFATSSPAVVPVPSAIEKPAAEARGEAEEGERTVPTEWDEVRAQEIQAAISSRVDQAIREMPLDYPRRQARLNVLARVPVICLSLAEKRNPHLWTWLDSLEQMIARWKKEDQMGVWPK